MEKGRRADLDTTQWTPFSTFQRKQEDFNPSKSKTNEITKQQQVERCALLASRRARTCWGGGGGGGGHVLEALLEANNAHLSTCCCFIISSVFDLFPLEFHFFAVDAVEFPLKENKSLYRLAPCEWLHHRAVRTSEKLHASEASVKSLFPDTPCPHFISHFILIHLLFLTQT